MQPRPVELNRCKNEWRGMNQTGKSQKEIYDQTQCQKENSRDRQKYNRKEARARVAFDITHGEVTS